MRQAAFQAFNTVSRSIQNHFQTILNYFDNRSTNASAESFNAKINAFRSQFRGERKVEFFLLFPERSKAREAKKTPVKWQSWFQR